MQGSTHRLEIHPPQHLQAGGEEAEHTTLRMSDLGEGEADDKRGEKEREEEEGREGVYVADEHADFESRIQSLQSEVDTLTARLEEEQQRQSRGVPLTRSSLRRHDNTTEDPRSSPEMRVLGQVASLMSSQLQRQQREEERVARQRRGELVRRLEEVERESCTVRDQVDQLHTSLKKLVCYTVSPASFPSYISPVHSHINPHCVK